MAERRMFAKSVVESDNFLDMPAEAQSLYFHLNMAADDYGFCDNPRSIMRACGAGNDTMKLLIAKKFVLAFDKNDGFIIVVKHWRINNYIREDRKHETKYKELMRDLYYDENNSYSANPGDGHVPCIAGQLTDNCQASDCQLTDNCHTEVRLGKDSIGKVNLGEDRTEKGESEGGNHSADLSPEERTKLIIQWKHRIDFNRKHDMATDWQYNLASTRDGISREEIDNFKEETDNDQT